MKLFFCSSPALLLQVFDPHVSRSSTKGVLTGGLWLSFIANLLHAIVRAIRGGISTSVQNKILSGHNHHHTLRHFLTTQICLSTMYVYLKLYFHEACIPLGHSFNREPSGHLYQKAEARESTMELITYMVWKGTWEPRVCGSCNGNEIWSWPLL